MITRSKLNYTNVNIHNLIDVTHTRRTSRSARSFKPSTILLFDIESVQLKFGDVTKWIPHQISWGIYSIKNNKVELLTKKNYYVSEVWINPEYNTHFSETYKTAHKKHIEKVINNDYPMKTSRAIMSKLIKNIHDFNVSTIAAYNIYQDFDCLKNMITYIPSKISLNDTLFNCKYSNPFRMNIRYCDLMHNIGIFYMDQLITEGLKDQKVFRNAKTKMIKLKGRDDSAGIYSAEYVLHKFFGISQSHIADEDVEVESKILEKLITDFGQDNIEYNVMYPAKLYDLFSSRIIRNYSKQIPTLYMFAKRPISISIGLPEITIKKDESKNTQQLQENPCNNDTTDNCPERTTLTII